MFNRKTERESKFICLIRTRELRINNYKTIMLEVIFKHDFLNDNIYFPTFYVIKVLLISTSFCNCGLSIRKIYL